MIKHHSIHPTAVIHRKRAYKVFSLADGHGFRVWFRESFDGLSRQVYSNERKWRTIDNDDSLELSCGATIAGHVPFVTFQMICQRN
jgi:hypothetical protein